MPVLSPAQIELHLKGAGVKSVYTQEEMEAKFGWVFSRDEKTVAITKAGDANGTYNIGTHVGKPGEFPAPVPAIHNVPISGATTTKRVTVLVSQ